ncbi:MAG TPA: lipopolysaccharide core heptose(I) kinase RfaP [Gammaproteobacteria bacterium]|jgi:heptose I phosphotransferase|nr:lipopolysaccharide core heptose(I) kinase RfaP [Gammaproteobacteria bacterium]
MFYLDEQLHTCFNLRQPLFDQLMNLKGETFRSLEGRTTQRVKLNGKNYFIKQHRGVGFREIIKNLLQLRLPVISAKNELLAIKKLHQLGIHVPAVAGFGERGKNPASRESFILMEELAPVTSLEMLCANWKKSPPSFAYKHYLLQQAAHIARTLHENGINHRDFYICHLLLEQLPGVDVEHAKLFLIDLHRAQIRAQIPLRWRIKDLAGLYFSSLDAGLTLRDLLRFMKYYRKMPLRDILRSEHQLWKKVKNRGDDLYRDHAK